MNAVPFPFYGPSAFPVASVVVLRPDHRPYLPPRGPPTGHWPHPCSSGQCPVGPSPKHHGRACTPLVVPSWLRSGLTSADRLCSATGAVCPPARAGRTRLHPPGRRDGLGCLVAPEPPSPCGQLDSARARSNPCHRRRPPRVELGAAASSSARPRATHCP